MKTAYVFAARLVAVALAVSAPDRPAFAHHCFPDLFDANAPVTLKGKIITVQWVNPHALIYVRAAEAGKPGQDWVFWAATPNTLLRTGVNKATLAEGVELTVRGFAANDKSCPVNAVTNTSVCFGDVRAVLLMDGRELYVGSSGNNAPGDPAPAAPAFGAPTVAQSAASWCPATRAAPLDTN